MKTSKEILENLLDALLEAEPILQDGIRPTLSRVREALTDIQTLADEPADASDRAAADRAERAGDINA